MDKELLIDICDRIRAQVEEYKQVDIDFGQLSSNQRAPIAYPCCLVDCSYNQCSDITEQNQQVVASIIIRMVFNPVSLPSHSGALKRNDALADYDVMKKTHQALQGWDNNGAFDPLTRNNAVVEKRGDGVRVFRATYTAQFVDDFTV